MQIVVAIEEIARLRAARETREPDPIHFALEAEMAGAQGILAHLRQDRRFLKEDDVDLLRRLLKSKLYLRLSPSQDTLHTVNTLRPDVLLLAGERRDALVSDGALDAVLLSGQLKGLIANIDRRYTRIMLMVDPLFDQIKAAAKLDVSGLVINLRDLTAGEHSDDLDKKVAQIQDAVKLARKYGLVVQVSNGIRRDHLAWLHRCGDIEALHTGHHLVSRALMSGVKQAVSDLLPHY